MRMIDHFIHGGTAGLAATRKGAVMDPNNGGQQAEVVLGGADALDRAVAAAQAAQRR
jgi:malonate-semialdehyde dehydrogenase (acetylating)/methylmalonate-semialdehyde dehydrogenase